MSAVEEIWLGSGLAQITGGQAIMLALCLLLLYLGIVRKFEPLLLVTIGFGGLLSNIPGVEIATGDGLLHLSYVIGIETGAFPLIIFMGVGALTDFGPLLANPKTLFPMVHRVYTQVAKAAGVPIIDMGGIQYARDAIEFLLAGATGLAIGTSLFVDPRCIVAIRDGITEYLTRHGHSSIQDIIGTLEV